MYTARIQNKAGEILTLSGNETEFQVVSITGLSQAPAQINLTPMAGIDGARFNTSKIQTRNIVFTFRIRGNAESNRLMLYRFFRTKEICRFYFSNESRRVYTDGYVETAEVDLFAMGQTMQVSVICPNPFFQSEDEQNTELTESVPLFSFPFAINEGEPVPLSNISDAGTLVTNLSEAETGAIFTILFTKDVSVVEIQNAGTGEKLVLRYSFRAGDTVKVDTHRGRKAVTLTRSGTIRNLFAAVDIASTFLQLDTGPNYFDYSADGVQYDPDVSVSVSYTPEYRGV